MSVMHLLVETGRASHIAACAGPRSGFEQGTEDIADVTCEACRHCAPRAWADGFGVWHVRVPAVHPNPRALAVMMLRDELTARDASVAPSVYEQPARAADLDTAETLVYTEGNPS